MCLTFRAGCALLAVFYFFCPALGFCITQLGAFFAFTLQPQFSAGRIRITHRLPPVDCSVMLARRGQYYGGRRSACCQPTTPSFHYVGTLQRGPCTTRVYPT